VYPTPTAMRLPTYIILCSLFKNIIYLSGQSVNIIIILLYHTLINNNDVNAVDAMPPINDTDDYGTFVGGEKLLVSNVKTAVRPSVQQQTVLSRHPSSPVLPLISLSHLLSYFTVVAIIIIIV